MNNTHQKALRRLAIRSLSIILLFVTLSYGCAVGLLLLAKIPSKYIPTMFIVGIVLFIGTLLFWVIFRKSFTKRAVLDQMKMLAKKEEETNEQIMTVLKEDLADAVGNWNKLALDKPRGNYKERYASRDKMLARLYWQSAGYTQQEIELYQLLNYF